MTLATAPACCRHRAAAPLPCASTSHQGLVGGDTDHWSVPSLSCHALPCSGALWDIPAIPWAPPGATTALSVKIRRLKGSG